jgi:hypothetical protein
MQHGDGVPSFVDCGAVELGLFDHFQKLLKSATTQYI